MPDVRNGSPAGGIASGSKAVRRCKRETEKSRVLKKKKGETKTKPCTQEEQVEAQTEVSVFSKAALSTFKMSRKRMSAISARSGIADKRPPQEDKNRCKTLLESR